MSRLKEAMLLLIANDGHFPANTSNRCATPLVVGV